MHRFMLQQKLMSKGNQEDLAEDLRPPDTGDFRMKIVDVNRTSKGGRAGRIMGCSALVVVGNNDVRT
jgi:ribosomal protein S5